jgi:hypothetical protein
LGWQAEEPEGGRQNLKDWLSVQVMKKIKS